jgi:hypothetical protein
MGKKMNEQSPIFVTIKATESGFKAFVALEYLASTRKDPELVLRQATQLYTRYVREMRSVVREVETYRVHHQSVPARTIWNLGDAIFRLRTRLKALSLQLDGVYEHLVRDLGVKRKWLEKVVTLRRYVSAQDAIPESLTWGRCEKGTRRVAESLQQRAMGSAPGKPVG